MTGGARRGRGCGGRNRRAARGGRGRGARLGWLLGPKQRGRGGGKWATTPPAHGARGGKGGGGKAGWAGRPAGPCAKGGGWAKMGRRGRAEKRKDFLFLLSIFSR
jgi:translation initiation factor IF-2